MTFTGPQRLVLWIGTVFCAVLLFLNVMDLRPLVDWRLPLEGWRALAVLFGCLLGVLLLVVDIWKGGAK